MAKVRANPARQTALTASVVGVIVVGVLFWAQSVLIPFALATLLAFLLAPLVAFLQRWHMNRKLSVVAVVLIAVLVLSGIVWVIKYELEGLVQELPSYSENIKEKVKYVRQMGGGGGMEGLGKMSQDITEAWDKTLAKPSDGAKGSAPVPGPAAAAVPQSPAPAPVVQSERPTWLSWFSALLSPVVASLGGAAVVLVLVVFMLLEREDLRNRLIRLVGYGRMTTTTKALDDVGERISSYLLMQLAVNGSYGLVWGLALFFLGVDYALLWGFLAAVLRYIPYIGAPIAALLPIALSLAQFPGWSLPLTVIGLFLVLELISNNVVEPWLYGQRIGVSAVAMIVSAAFWTFLWGPVGLVLAGPLTVCLVVLGKHVPQLEFLAVLLGDEPALDTDVSYYQRLLARDQDEATQLILAQLKAAPAEQVYDELLVPALVYARRDRDADELTSDDEELICQATREILEDLGERRLAASPAAVEDAANETVPEPPPARIRVLACPARDSRDRLALEMFQQLLDPAQWEMELAAVETLTAEMVEQVAGDQPAIVCIGALPPGGLAHTRHLCKRLRARCPHIKIVVGRWGLEDNVEANREELHEAGANLIATSLLDTRKQMNEWLPVLAYEEAQVATGQPQSTCTTA